MRAFFLVWALLLVTVSCQENADAAGCTGTGNCYWVGGTGNWNDTTKWATASGGATTGGLPGAGDTCNFDSLSNATAYTMTVNASSTCLDLVLGAPLSGKVTWAGSSALAISGNMNLSGGTAGITRTYTGTITFNSTASQTITSSGITFASAIVFNGVAGTWTLQDTFNTSAAGTLTNGTLDTNGKTTSFGGAFNHNATGTAVLTLGASTFNVGSINWTVTGLTLNAGTSTIGSGNVTISSGDSFTFNNLSVPTSNGVTILFAANQTINGTFTFTQSSVSNRALMKSGTLGTPVTITAAAVSLTGVDFVDIVGAGAATWSGTRLGDCKGNSGITFAAPVSRYWTAGTSNWRTATNPGWATTSGGAGANTNRPLCQDTAVFDANSFSADGQTVTIDTIAFLPTISTSSTDQTYTLSFTGAVTAVGDITLDNNATISGTSAITFGARNTQTITSSGKSWTMPLLLDTVGGTLKLGDNMTLTGATSTGLFTHTSGALDLNTHTLSATRFTTSGSTARTLKDSAGTGKVATTDTTATTVFTATTTTGLTVDRTNAWTIEIGGNTTNTRTANLGSGISWPALTFTNTTASGELDIVSASTTTVLKSLAVSTPPQTIKRTAATTISIEDATTGFPSGTVGNLVTIASITAASHTWAKTGAGTISSDYLSISRSTVTPACTFFAGTHSTDGGNNSGWVFTAPASCATGNSNFFPFFQ